MRNKIDLSLRHPSLPPLNLSSLLFLLIVEGRAGGLALQEILGMVCSDPVVAKSFSENASPFPSWDPMAVSCSSRLVCVRVSEWGPSSPGAFFQRSVE